MKNNQDYIKDIADIRQMMERSSKFLSLSGLAGIMAGIYALAGAYLLYSFYHFNPDAINYTPKTALPNIILLAILILIAALTTAVLLSYRSAGSKGEKFWNPAFKRFAESLLIPLTAGGILILILISKGLLGLAAPVSLIFYGLAMYNSSKFTVDELKYLGLLQTALGLLSTLFIEYALPLWALGFGAVHIVYGAFMYFKYER